MKQVYGRVFIWLVQKINEAIYKPGDQSRRHSIGVLGKEAVNACLSFLCFPRSRGLAGSFSFGLAGTFSFGRSKSCYNVTWRP